MKILSFDISSKCTGWALYDSVDKKILNCGRLLAPKYFEGLTKNELLMGQALYWFYGSIRQILFDNKADVVVAEDINIRHITTMRTLSQFHAIATLAVIKSSISSLLPGNSFSISKVLVKVHNATMRSYFGLQSNPKLKKLVTKKYGSNVSKKDQTIASMVYLVNEKYTFNYGYSDIITIAKNEKIDPIKVLIVEIISRVYGLDLNYSDHDIADACALAITYAHGR